MVNFRVDEDYLGNNLPEGWTYDCYIGEDLPWHFTIYAPGDPEPFRNAFQSIDQDGNYVLGDRGEDPYAPAPIVNFHPGYGGAIFI